MKYENVYIAGKITGDPDYRAKFQEAEEQLVKVYNWNRWYIVNPAKACPEGWPWWRCMVMCLWLVAGCKVVAMLPDWNESRGAKIEHRWAEILRKQIIYLY